MADEPITQKLNRCSRCLQSKPADREHFSFIRSKNKWHPWCKPCCAQSRREDRAARPDHYRKISAESVERHREVVNARNRDRYHRERDDNLTATRQRMAENKDRYNANRRAKRAANAEEARRKAQQARDANREAYRAYAKNAWKNASPQRRLRTYFTSAICHSLKGSSKGGRSWEALFGYSADDLRAHLERQFQPRMSWDNYGEWHVDHIVPVASFIFQTADDPEFRACWAITNLRPMWAAENLRKSSKRVLLI